MLDGFYVLAGFKRPTVTSGDIADHLQLDIRDWRAQGKLRGNERQREMVCLEHEDVASLARSRPGP